MFSKIITFGLETLALVHAAPSFQVPMVSCNVNIGASGTLAHLLPDIPSGNYHVYNEAWGSAQLRSHSTTEPIFVSLTRESVGPFGMWKIEPQDDTNEKYAISNIGLGVPVHNSGNLIFPGEPGEAFAIERAGQDDNKQDVFTIKVPSVNKVWTVDTNTVRSNVSLKEELGLPSQKWKFVPVPLIPSGTYHVYNEAWGSLQLRSYSNKEPIFISDTVESPGNLSMASATFHWKIEPHGNSNEYTISNLGLEVPVHKISNLIFTGQSDERFAIEYAGQDVSKEDVFTIKVSSENSVWTVDTNTVRSNVSLKRLEQGLPSQKWKFVPVPLN
ncbi:hypothetical protein DFH07DRAFT_965927 [Mycena maculata]|uniref:Uncharacterized protein n=1 Tax=Mycena maculata TaxID=230809 RepID=A0AAD7IAN9_9AGAR|nr:hypothetical protein DFH07DRAFT_965927 [Mycena maculata]